MIEPKRRTVAEFEAEQVAGRALWRPGCAARNLEDGRTAMVLFVEEDQYALVDPDHVVIRNSEDAHVFTANQLERGGWRPLPGPRRRLAAGTVLLLGGSKPVTLRRDPLPAGASLPYDLTWYAVGEFVHEIGHFVTDHPTALPERLVQDYATCPLIEAATVEVPA